MAEGKAQSANENFPYFNSNALPYALCAMR
jgi:hypothetical protein